MARAEHPITLITGATRGIGESTARQLSERGHMVVIAARDHARATALAAALPGPAEVLPVDLASLASVRDLAAKVRARYEHLDVLINNAGVLKRRRELSADGFELSWAVNHLAPFLLSELLLDLLDRCGGRLINVNSEGHRAALMSPRPVVIDFDNLQGERGYTVFGAYSQAKLAGLMTTYEHARRARGATVNAIHPGTIKTDIARELPSAITIPFHALVSGSARDAGAAVVHLATAVELEGVSGRYFDRFREVRSSSASLDRAVSERVWSTTCEMVGVPAGHNLTLAAR
jgi:retinol dehydrogenase-12